MEPKYEASRTLGDRKQFKKLQNALDYIKDAPVTEDRPCILNLRDFDFTTCYLVWGKHKEEGRIKACLIHDEMLKQESEIFMQNLQKEFSNNRKRAKNDRYGEDVLAARYDEFNGLRVCGVRETTMDDEGRFEVVVDNETPQFFSVYAICKDGTEECVGDFATLILALDYTDDLNARYGWPVHLAKWYGWPLLKAA